jgi:hypothetical protein
VNRDEDKEEEHNNRTNLRDLREDDHQEGNFWEDDHREQRMEEPTIMLTDGKIQEI